MRIIIETDSNAQPRIQMGQQGTDLTEGLQTGAINTSNAIDAGPPKVGAANQQQPATGNLPAAEGAAPQSDNSSAGSAPKELNA